MDFTLLETKLIWATERKIEAESLHSPMFPDDIPVWLIRRGRMKLRYDDETTEAKAGEWVLPKRGSAWHDFTDDAVILSLRFRLRWLNREEFFERSHTVVLKDPADGSMRAVAETLVARAEPATPADYFVQQSAFYRWLELYAKILHDSGLRLRDAGQTDPRLIRAREWLDAAALSQRIPRLDFAARVGWSLPQLTRRFTAEYGVTPRTYFEQRRFSCARAELTRGRLTIKEIAGELGFGSLAQFSNWFSRHAKKSPRHYRGQVHL